MSWIKKYAADRSKQDPEFKAAYEKKKQSYVRLSIPITHDQKNVLARAAAIRGMSLNQFVLDAALRQAKTQDEMPKLFDDTTPAKPNLKLRETMRQKPLWDN
jgi:uncharacterized protein (DUF1778 family)